MPKRSSSRRAVRRSTSLAEPSCCARCRVRRLAEVDDDCHANMMCAVLCYAPLHPGIHAFVYSGVSQPALHAPRSFRRALKKREGGRSSCCIPEVTAIPIGTSIAAVAVLDMNIEGTNETSTNASSKARGRAPTCAHASPSIVRLLNINLSTILGTMRNVSGGAGRGWAVCDLDEHLQCEALVQVHPFHLC